MTSRSRPRSESRRNTPLSPPKAPPLAIAPDASNQNKRQTRSSSREIATAQQQLQNIEQVLPTVREYEDDVAPVQNGDVDDDFSEIGPSSTGSSLQELLDALNRDAIIDNLRDLYRDSVDLISLFKSVGDQAIQAIVNPAAQANPRLLNNLNTKTKRLLEDRENYGNNHHSGDIDFVEPDLILRKIFGLRATDDFPSGVWRPDAVFYLANLALQVVQVLNPDKQVRDSYLQKVFNKLPELFNDFSRFQPSVETWEGMYDLYVEVLTQYYLIKVEIEQGQVGFDPDTVLATVFFDENGEVQGSWDKRGMSRALERSKVIREYFDSTSSSFIDFEGLKEKYPWSDFAVHTIRWTLAMRTELEELVESKGGVARLVDMLVDGNFDDGAVQATGESTADDDEARDISEVEGGKDDLIAHSAAEAEVITMTAPVTNKRPGLVAAYNYTRGTGGVDGSLMRPLERPVFRPTAGGGAPKPNKDLVEAARARYAALKSDPSWKKTPQDDSQSEVESQPNREVPQPPTSSYHDEGLGMGMGMDDEQDPDEDESVIQRRDHAADDSDDEDFIATQQAAILQDTVRRQKEQSNKEYAPARAKKRSFLDPQAGAEIIQWDSEFPNHEDIPPTRRSPKRSRNQAHNDSDEDDGEFETDTRARKRSRIDIERIRKPASTQTRHQGADEDLEETDDLDSDRRVQPHVLTSRPRLEPSRAPLRKPTTSQERARPTFQSLSPQRERSIPQRSSSSRAPLQPISSGSRAVPSSSAPARSDPTAPSSSLPSSRSLPPSHQDPPRGGSRLPSASQEPPSTQARRVNQEAKERMRMARDLKQTRRPVQTRIPYSADEVDRLSEMIALYGTQWARILREDNAHPDGPVLQGRSQVQLKDKARNLKLDALKAGERLAPGFEFVSVGNAKLEELRLLGIDYFEGQDAARYHGRGGRNDEDDIED